MKPQVVIFAFFLAILSGHYTEIYQIEFFSTIKNIMYFGSIDKTKKTREGLVSKYPDVANGIINPVTNAQTVLQGSENYLTKKYYPEGMPYTYGNEHLDQEKLIEMVDWFMSRYKEEIVANVRLVRFPYDMDLPVYNIKKPWYSGMAQGHALIIALAAYDITGNKKYLYFADKIAKVLDVPIEQGGVKIVLPAGVWFEEYAGNYVSGDKLPKVLNGNIFAIDGLFWYWHFNKDSAQITRLLESSITTLDKEIHQYKSMFWSYYDLWGPNYADASYHAIHIMQLRRVDRFYAKKLGINTENIGIAADQFSLYQKIPLGYIERLVLQHNRMIILITFSNMLCLLGALLILDKFARKGK